MKPKVLDLFCGAGGCSVGYSLAGYNVTGVDLKESKNYPFKFIKSDALDILDDLPFCRQFDLIHASPPCQHYSVATLANGNRDSYPDLVAIVRDKLQDTGVPYVIENVPGAPLKNYLVLCGCMFEGLRVIRKRLFECSPEIYFPPYACKCGEFPNRGAKVQYQSFKTHRFITVAGKGFNYSDGKIAMGIDWMTGKELTQSIPPPYTEFIGKQMIQNLNLIQHGN